MFEENDDPEYILEGFEKKILDYITRNTDATHKEIARAAGTDELTARRLYNRLFAENVCSQMIIPNYPLLGYKVMMIQKIDVASKSLSDVPFITGKIVSEWKNCIDCHETFDGKIYVRSIWKSAEIFKQARRRFYQKHGMDWLAGEEVDMVPLSVRRGVFNVRSLWQDDVESEEPET